MKLQWVVEGLFWCTVKGVRAVFFHKPVSKRNWMKNLFGWQEEIIDSQGRDIWKEQVTLPRGGKSHHRTDLIVEWNRLNSQRGAKLFCFFSFITFLTGIVLTYVTTSLF